MKEVEKMYHSNGVGKEERRNSEEEEEEEEKERSRSG